MNRTIPEANALEQPYNLVFVSKFLFKKPFHFRSFVWSEIHDEVTNNQNQDDKRVKQRINRVIVINNNQSDHGRDTYVQKVSERKVIVFFEVFNNHCDKFKV